MFFELLSIFGDVVIPVFLTALAGYIAGPRLKLEARTLSRSAYFIFIPAFVFSTMSQAEVPLSLAMRMSFYIILVHLACALLGWGVAKLLKRSDAMVAAYIMAAFFSNVGNFGLSLIEFRLGEVALIPGTVYFLAVSMVAFVVCVGAASWASQSSETGAIWSVFKTPALLALIPVLFFRGLDLEIPLFISRTTGLLAEAMIPIMLVTLGVQLSQVEMPRITLDVILASSVRLLGGPILAALFVLLFGFTGLERGAGIIQASMPVGVTTSIIAIEYDIVPEFVTTTILFSTLVSLLTLTIVLSLI